MSNPFSFAVRPAALADVDRIVALGAGTDNFSVSQETRFYERAELIEWIERSADNILLIAQTQDQLIGLLYCKQMSRDWALLDALYVLPASRKLGVGVALLTTLVRELERRSTRYVSALAPLDETFDTFRDVVAIYDFLGRNGFRAAKRYIWCERVLTTEKP